MRKRVLTGLVQLAAGVWLLAACATPPAPVQQVDAPEGSFGEETAVTMQNTPSVAPPPQGSFVPDESFRLCWSRVRNAPVSDAHGNVPSYAQLFVVDQVVALATVPVNGGCLSSGFGLRNGRLHKAIDIAAARGTWIYSAAPGIVREAGWGGSYGNYILIDHGYGIFTRYAHMDAFVEGLDVGTELGFGWAIGTVGNTSTQRVGVHLHYEVLTGDYNNPRKSFGLQANDPFGFPSYNPVAVPAG